jgi:hypothetical protein
MDNTQNCLDFHKDPAIAICKGCQGFRNRLFDPKPLQEGHIVIHKNFAELSNCADNSCDLCKYIRRELSYHSRDFETYSFKSEDFQNVHHGISVKLSLLDWKAPGYRTTIENRYWHFFLGPRSGPQHFHAHNNQVKDRSLTQQRIPDENIGRDRLLSLSREWLKTCTTKHEKCGPQAGVEPGIKKS